MSYGVSNAMWWERWQMHAVWQQMHAVWRSRTNMNLREFQLKNAVANWRKGVEQIWNVNLREIQLKNAVANWRKGVANWRKGEKQLHSRTQCTFASFVTEKVRLHVLTIPIMCTFIHFLCIFLPQSTSEPQFPCFRHLVLPTHNTVSWGTWLSVTSLKTSCLPSWPLAGSWKLRGFLGFLRKARNKSHQV